MSDMVTVEIVDVCAEDDVKPLPNLDPNKARIVVTADWHIRVRPDIPEDWQLKRYRSMFRMIAFTCIRQNAYLVLAGDILDRNRPSLLELDLLMEFLTMLEEKGIVTFLISGNHENLGQGASTYDYLQQFLSKLENVRYNSSNEIFSPLENDVDLYMVGHPALPTFEHSALRTNKTNIMVSHFRPTVNQFIQEEIDVAKFIEPYDLVVAGDIHMPLDLYNGKLLYTNHPLNSCYESSPDCGCLIVEANKAGIKTERISFNYSPNLIQIKTTAADYKEPEEIEGVQQSYYRIEVTGSPEELRKITTDKWYIKLLKVPEVISEYVAEAEVAEEAALGTEGSLQEYMRSMDMDDNMIARMIAVFREVD